MPAFICLCEEVTLSEVMKVVKEEGIRDLETLKRRLRVGMGSCTGMYCINLLLRLYPKIFGETARYRSDSELHIPTSRPLLKPVRLGLFKAGR